MTPASASPSVLRQPVLALPGVGPTRAARLAVLGVGTIGDLLRLPPRRYEDRTRVTPLAEALRGLPRPPAQRAPGQPAHAAGAATASRGTDPIRGEAAPALVPALAPGMSAASHAAGGVTIPGAPAAAGGFPDAAPAPPAAALFHVQVHAASAHRPRAGMTLLRARVSDGTAAVDAIWFNQPHLRPLLRPGDWLYLYGRLQWMRGRPTVAAAEVEPDDGTPALAGRLVPVYPLTSGLSQRTLRILVRAALSRAADAVPEPLPGDLRASLGLPHAAAALQALHAPADPSALAAARRRLAFEELLCLQLGLGLRRRGREADRRSFRYAPPGEASRVFRARLPFPLTGAQARALAEIEADLLRPAPMYRLLQGDVGSGKTVVAAAALLRAVESGRQAALMAPTEILAEQHHQRIGPWLGGLGARVRILSGRLGPADRARILDELARGEADLAIGTHALIQDGVRFRALGLVVTDEQHRFGVRQRDLLHRKGERPDVLAMTATPIPRTLAFTVYGDLDVSVLDEAPPGRGPVRTHWRDPAARGRVYAFVAKELAAGRQAFVVCPRVGEGEDDDGEAMAVSRWVAELRRRWLPAARVAALHGRMPAAEKEAVMRAFAQGDVQCLVATTVVEVGVDVPNASVMVVEGADRFGLAQLHQLRGRVGRGPHASWCVLVAPDRGGPVAERLRTLERSQDGFAIAEADLRLRGPGELLGLRQHGLPELVFADLAGDLPLLRAARDAAAHILAADPSLGSAEHGLLRAEVVRLFGGGIGWEA